MKANGTFDVALTPQADIEGTDEGTPGRMIISKTFRGDLQGESKGQMLAARTEVQGSAGYVAIEKVRGILEGRSGTFVLQHYGLMTRGTSQLTVTVVPDSGTEELIGLAGTMTINIAEGTHFYEFEYSFAG